jgi:hypothetical protein
LCNQADHVIHGRKSGRTFGVPQVLASPSADAHGLR